MERIIQVRLREKHKLQCFIEILRGRDFFEVGQYVLLQDFETMEILLRAEVKHVREITRKDLTNEITYMNNEVNVQTHNNIDEYYLNLNSRAKLSPDDFLQVVTFQTKSIYVYMGYDFIKGYKKILQTQNLKCYGNL